MVILFRKQKLYSHEAIHTFITCFIYRYFNIISIVFMILLIGGFVLIKYLL